MYWMALENIRLSGERENERDGERKRERKIEITVR